MALTVEAGEGQYGMGFNDDGRQFLCRQHRHIMTHLFERRYADRNPYSTMPNPTVDIAVDGPKAALYRISPEEPWRVMRTKWRVEGLEEGIEAGGRASGYFSSACGLTIYRGNAFPREYVGDAFVADPAENIVHHRKVVHTVPTARAERPADEIVTGGLNDDPKVHSPHHRGIFCGFNRITYGNGKRADTWHCTDGAFQQHERFLASEQGPVLARHRVAISWHGADTAFAEEERELTVYHVPGGHLIEFASRLRSTSGRVRIDGDPQHAGFQFRAHNDVDAYTTNETIFVRPEGIGKRGETRNWDPQTRQGPVNLPWNAMSFVLGDKRYTVAYLDHPENPKEARFSEREYGRFGSYFEYTIENDKPLTVNYRLWLQEGLMRPKEIAVLSNNFVEPLSVTVLLAE